MRHPIIVLEGPDGGGKTTLAKQLVQDYGFKYLHLTYRFKDKMDLYHWAAFEQCLKWSEHTPVVLDRWWPSEVIYADVFRGGSKWPYLGRFLDRAALRYGVTYVFCLPSDEDEYLRSFEKLKASRTEMYDSVKEVYHQYVDLYESMPARLDMVDYDLYTHGQNLGDYCQFLWDLSNQLTDDSWVFPADIDNKRTFAGNVFNPKVVLVGEQTNKKTRRDVWPFFENANCSLWLTKKLVEAGVDESSIMWMNALHNGEINHEELSAASYRVTAPVIIMGHRAAEAVSKTSFGYDHIVRHPQWCRRFRPDDTTIANLVKKIVEKV